MGFQRSLVNDMGTYQGGMVLPYESNIFYVIFKALPGVTIEILQAQLGDLIDIAEDLKASEMDFFLGGQVIVIDEVPMVVLYQEFNYDHDENQVDPLFKEILKQLHDLCEPPFFTGTHLIWGAEREILYS